MVTADKCRKAAQVFLDDLADRLQKLPPAFNSQKELAKAAGVSEATPSDYKNKKKMEKPEFRTVFQVAYALLGRSPCSMGDPTCIANHKISKALDIDADLLLIKLARIIMENPKPPALQYIKSLIDTASEEIQIPFQTQDTAV